MRGAKPKIYDPAIVARVRELYAAGHTQAEIAGAIGCSQKVVWNLMRRNGIVARLAAKRDQRGSRNHAWRGAAAGYAALHQRVVTARGAPSVCEDCGTTTAKRYEWASLTGRYEDTADHKRLCVSCHHRFDGTVRNLRGRVC